MSISRPHIITKPKLLTQTETFTQQNLILNSDDLSAYTGSNLTVQTNLALNPITNLTNADQITDSSDGGAVAHTLTLASLNLTNGAIYCMSVWAKKIAGAPNWFILGPNNAATAGAYFDLVNGVVGTGTGAYLGIGMIPMGGGYLCWISYLADANRNTVKFYSSTGNGSSTYTGTGTARFYLGSVQMTRVDVVQPYIGTTNAIVGTDTQLKLGQRYRYGDSASLPVVWNSSTSVSYNPGRNVIKPKIIKTP